MKTIFGFVLIFALLFIGSAGTTGAEVNLNINFGFPAVVSEPPTMIIITPGVSYAYIGFDAYFYGGYLWSIREGRWYRASKYNGKWGKWVVAKNVPGSLRNAPKNAGKYRNDYNARISSKKGGNQSQGKKGGGRKH